MSFAQDAVAATTEEVGLASKVRAFITQAKLLASDGLSVSEFFQLAFALMQVLVAAAEGVPAAGPDRKKYVMHALAVFYDDVSDLLVPMYVRPLWLMFKPGFRAVYLRQLDGAIEAFVPFIRGL